MVHLHIATETEGVFRVGGSEKRMRELQDVFDTPPNVRNGVLTLVWQGYRLDSVHCS